MSSTQPTAERIVAHLPFSLRPAYALDATLGRWTDDRAQAHRFADALAAGAAIDARCRTIAGDPWVDPYLAGPYRVLRPTVEDEARAYVDPAAR